MITSNLILIGTKESCFRWDSISLSWVTSSENKMQSEEMTLPAGEKDWNNLQDKDCLTHIIDHLSCYIFNIYRGHFLSSWSWEQNWLAHNPTDFKGNLIPDTPAVREIIFQFLNCWNVREKKNIPAPTWYCRDWTWWEGWDDSAPVENI